MTGLHRNGDWINTLEQLSNNSLFAEMRKFDFLKAAKYFCRDSSAEETVQVTQSRADRGYLSRREVQLTGLGRKNSHAINEVTPKS